jgi:hypothetical protein
MSKVVTPIAARVEVIGKPKHNILVSQPAAPQPQGNKSEPIANKGLGQLSPDTKRAIAAYVDSQSDLYRFCYQTAQGKLEGVITDLETTRCMATTLYLGAVRKFGLDR